MSLLFRPEDRDQVKAIFAQKQVAWVAQIGCIHKWSVFVKSCDHTSWAADLFVLVWSLDDDVTWIHEGTVISSFSNFAD